MRGELRFAEEPIAEIGPLEISMDGQGRTGACAGDSGGPLLVADGSGSPRIAGVLSAGSVDCLGVDLYVRSDSFLRWVEAKIADEPRCDP